ncbi:MAG: helix-turn-helix domain-containing protein [Oscillospiraceae bacterium]|jgi:transcriptional regulator with XRE-family HTH domain|nr:helix-turn-helix domain-containing protein [Oscillospiraceae bacterium]
MNLYIAESIRRLRRERGVTQERLAEAVGVTTQAVSKWERGEAYPDITLVLPLAEYFGVRADTLLGVDKARDEARIAEYISRINASSKHDNAETLRLAREMYAEFPNDWDAIGQYITALWSENLYAGGPFGWVTNGDEIIRLCTRVREECTVAWLRFSAAHHLIDVYRARGELDKAAELVSEFPGMYLYTAPELRLGLLKGDEWRAQYRETIQRTFDHLVTKLRNLPPSVTDIEARAAMYEKCLAVIELFFEDGDFGVMYQELALVCCQLAECYAELGRGENAAEFAARGLGYAERYDAISGVYTYTSMFVSGVTADFDNGLYGPSRTCVSEQLEILERCADKFACRELTAVLESCK